MKNLFIVIAGLAIVAATCGAAAAQSAEAETLFRDGKKLMAKGQYAEACAAFEGSFKKDPAATTLLNLADCREKNGQLASAWGHFVEAARLARGQGAIEQSARDRADALEPRLSYLVVAVSPDVRVDGLVIRRDRAPLDPAEWNRKMPVDGGVHTIDVSAPAHALWSTTIVVAPSGDEQTLTVPSLVPAPLPAPAPRAATGMTGRRKAAIAAWSLGAVALGGAVGFELSARSAYDDAKAATTNPARQAAYDTANDRRLYGSIALGVGVAAVAAGTVLWITGRRAPAEIAVSAGPARTGITFGWAY
jgi:tetratricopeptide (TPR) repeat protein